MKSFPEPPELSTLGSTLVSTEPQPQTTSEERLLTVASASLAIFTLSVAQPPFPAPTPPSRLQPGMFAASPSSSAVRTIPLPTCLVVSLKPSLAPQGTAVSHSPYPASYDGLHKKTDFFLLVILAPLTAHGASQAPALALPAPAGPPPLNLARGGLLLTRKHHLLSGLLSIRQTETPLTGRPARASWELVPL